MVQLASLYVFLRTGPHMEAEKADLRPEAGQASDRTAVLAPMSGLR